jgi:hypothetical protein
VRGRPVRRASIQLSMPAYVIGEREESRA